MYCELRCSNHTNTPRLTAQARHRCNDYRSLPPQIYHRLRDINFSTYPSLLHCTHAPCLSGRMIATDLRSVCPDRSAEHAFVASKRDNQTNIWIRLAPLFSSRVTGDAFRKVEHWYPQRRPKYDGSAHMRWLYRSNSILFGSCYKITGLNPRISKQDTVQIHAARVDAYADSRLQCSATAFQVACTNVSVPALQCHKYLILGPRND